MPMTKTISLPLESFALVKAGRPVIDRPFQVSPRWANQLQGLRFNLDEQTKANLSAQLVVEHNARFDFPSMWEAHFWNGDILKYQRDKIFLLQHKRWVDERGNLHNDNDAAFVSGKTKLYYLHGVLVEEPKFITTPIEQIDAGRILAITSVDLRREMIRRKGLEQFLGQLFHRVIDKRGNYELLQVIIGESTRQFGTYLKMLNPSIGVWHMEGVPNEIRTVQDALLWRNQGWFVDADRLT